MSDEDRKVKICGMLPEIYFQSSSRRLKAMLREEVKTITAFDGISPNWLCPELLEMMACTDPKVKELIDNIHSTEEPDFKEFLDYLRNKVMIRYLNLLGSKMCKMVSLTGKYLIAKSKQPAWEDDIAKYARIAPEGEPGTIKHTEIKKQ